jgi:hypothetical protein
LKEPQLLRDEYRSEPDSYFHLPAYYRLHRGDRRGAYFELFDGRAVAAAIHFTEVADGLWRSPARGTFAGPLADPELSLAELQAFLGRVDAELRRNQARSAEIRLAPEAHDSVAFARSVYLLRNLGYEVSSCDLNYSLSIDERPLAQRMSYGNRKRLNKCTREGLTAERLTLSSLPQVYAALAANRTSKGYPLSMTFAQVAELAEKFPDRVVLFGVPAGETLAAAALCLKLSSHILYVFYWGDQPGFSTASPVVALAERIYRFCQEAGFRLLDVGTSTLDREPNHGLIQFKRGLGFSESLKLRMAKAF